MTPKQEFYRKQLIIKIHINKHYKEIKENGAWQDWLFYRFNVLSSKELSIKELNVVLDILNGKVPDSLELEPDIAGRNLTKKGKITPKQINKILSLKKSLDWDDKKFIFFCAKQTSVLLSSVKNISKLDKAEGTKILTGLIKVEKFFKKC